MEGGRTDRAVFNKWVWMKTQWNVWIPELQHGHPADKSHKVPHWLIRVNCQLNNDQFRINNINYFSHVEIDSFWLLLIFHANRLSFIQSIDTCINSTDTKTQHWIVYELNFTACVFNMQVGCKKKLLIFVKPIILTWSLLLIHSLHNCMKLVNMSSETLAVADNQSLETLARKCPATCLHV